MPHPHGPPSSQFAAPPRVSQAPLFGGSLLAALAAAWLGEGLLLRHAEPPFAGATLLGALFVVAAAALYGATSPSPWRPFADVAPTVTLEPAARRRAALGLFGASALAWALACWWNALVWPLSALGAWALALALFLAGVARTAPPGVRELRAILWANRRDIAALALLTLLALALRLWAIGQLPTPASGDESEMGVFARIITREGPIAPFATGWRRHANLWFFMQSAALAIFGDSLAGLRTLSALWGAAAIPGTYLLARVGAGRRIAWIAACVLAGYHFHLHFSRLGINNIADPTLAAFAFAALLHGYRTRGWLSFALAGVGLGLAQHLYAGARLLPLVALAFLLVQLVARSRVVWTLRGQLVLLTVGFLLACGPMLFFWWAHPNALLPRVNQVGLIESGLLAQRLADGESLLGVILQQVGVAFGAFVYQPDSSLWYVTGMPLLDQASAVLFCLGLALALRRWRHPATALLVAWLLAVHIFGGSLLADPTSSPRFVAAVPPVCLLVALGIDAVASIPARCWRRSARVTSAVGAAILGALIWWQAQFYFLDYSTRYRAFDHQAEAVTLLGNFLQSRAPGTYVFMVGPPFMGFGSLRFLADGVQGATIVDPAPAADAFPPVPDGRRPLFAVAPERAAVLDALVAQFPGGERAAWHARLEPSAEVLLLYDPSGQLGITGYDRSQPIPAMGAWAPPLFGALVVLLTLLYGVPKTFPAADPAY